VVKNIKKAEGSGKAKEDKHEEHEEDHETHYMPCPSGPNGLYCRQKYAKKGYKIVNQTDPPERSVKKGTLTGGVEMHVGIIGQPLSK